MIDNDDDDRRLVERYRAGRDDAFDALYARHTPRMYGLAVRLSGGNDADAGDIVQEAWLRALRRLDAFAWASRLSTWLCGICVNIWREHTRGPGPALWIDGVAEVADRRTTATATYEPIDVERALVRLAPGYRAVLVLHAIYGYPHADVAALLDISEGTSKSQLARARRALKTALGDDGAKEDTA